jgi:hypothetical protein
MRVEGFGAAAGGVVAAVVVDMTVILAPPNAPRSGPVRRARRARP